MRDANHWSSYEGEVSLYFANEEGVSAQSYDPNPSPPTEPRPPRFAPGVSYWLMMTVIDRLKQADVFMPVRPLRVSLVEGEMGLQPTQRLDGIERPSATMVLRCAYGVKSCRYDDSAPDGARLLREARQAYARAAQVVPERKSPSRMQRLQARLDRLLGV